MTSKNFKDIHYFITYQDKYLGSCEDDVLWLISCILCSLILLLYQATKKVRDMTKCWEPKKD